MNWGKAIPFGAPALVPLLFFGATEAQAQSAAIVEAIAPLVQSEDSRLWSPTTLEAGTFSPEPLVRRTAAMAIGRIGDLRGTALLIPMLLDQDSTIQPSAAFALGLLRDPAAVAPLISRLTAMPTPTLETARAIVTALAKIGGPEAAELLARVLSNTANLTIQSPEVLVRLAALDAAAVAALGGAPQPLSLTALALGGVAAALHLRLMRQALRSGMRRPDAPQISLSPWLSTS